MIRIEYSPGAAKGGDRIKRSQVVKEDPFADRIRILIVHRFDTQEGEEALPLLRRSYLAADRITRPQIEFLDLRWGDVNIVGRREIVVVHRAEEAVAIGQHFEHPLAERQTALLRLRFQNLEDELLLPEITVPGNIQLLRNLVELGDLLGLELSNVHGHGKFAFLRGRTPASTFAHP
jgi:hypothetical protein